MADTTTTRLLTGAVPFVILLAAILAIPICAALLRWYRKSVAAGMAKTSGRPFNGQGDSRPPGPPPLGRLEIIEAPDVRSPLAARPYPASISSRHPIRWLGRVSPRCWARPILRRFGRRSLACARSRHSSRSMPGPRCSHSV